MAEKQVFIFGKKYKYKNVPQLSKQLNIGGKKKSIAKKRLFTKQALAKVNTSKKIYNEATGDFQEIDLSQKPLLLREFTGQPRITKKAKDFILTQQEPVILQVFDENDNPININIEDKNKPFKIDNILNIKYTITFRIVTSSNDGTLKSRSRRKQSGHYRGPIGNGRENFDNLVITFVDPGISDQFFLGTSTKEFNEPNIKNTSYYTNRNLEDFDFNDQGDFFQYVILQITNEYSFCDRVLIEKLFIKNAKDNKNFDLKNMKMTGVKCNLSINYFTNLIDVDHDGKCVLAYLKIIYPKINIDKYFSNQNIENGINTNQIIQFCKRYNILLIAYDINKNIIGSYYPNKKTRCYKNLIYLAHNSHIYPLKNRLLESVKKNNLEHIRLSKSILQEKFNELLFERIKPTDIVIGNVENNNLIINSFTHDNKVYFKNGDYDDCYKLLEAFGIQEEITPRTTMYNVINLIEKLYIEPEQIFSFLPQIKDVKLGGYYAINKDLENIDIEDTITIDKNKDYGDALSRRKYIYVIDCRKDKIIKNDNNEITEINESYYYIIKPKQSTYLLPSTIPINGEHLLYAQNEGLKFDILYELQTRLIENNLSQFIDDYYNKIKNIKFKNETFMKDVINIYIGKFDKNIESKEYDIVIKICNKNEADNSNGENVQFDNDTFIFYDKKTYDNIYTRKLLGFDIKNESRFRTYKLLKELQLKDSDIYSLNVDAITILKDSIDDKVLKQYIDKNDYRKYKIIDYKSFNDKQYNNNNIVFDNIQIINNRNELHLGPAGNGKTYKVINKVIPELIKKNISYLVVTPSHSVLEEYRKNNLNCNVIQKYNFTFELPKEKVIIVDEIGLCDRKAQDILYKWALNGKIIKTYGDFNQLPPIDCTKDTNYNQKFYSEVFYKHKFMSNINHRNTFTIEYYNQLINEELNLIEEMKKHMCENIFDSEVIICHRNKNYGSIRGCEYYNNLVMNHLNIKFGDIGCKVMCKTNLLRNYNIYNNFLFTITNVDDEFVYLDDDYKIPKNKFFRKDFFIPAYARTHYNIQGKSLSSYYIPNEQFKFFNFGRCAYTIISRLKF